jgi:hypothetical protein
MLLLWTSGLFSTVVVHAFYAREPAYHHLFLAVSMLSMVRYCTEHPLAKLLDTVAAHTAFFAALLDEEVAINRPWLRAFPLAVAFLWFAERWAPPNRADALHAGLHVAAVAGMHMYLDRPEGWAWPDARV